MRATLTFAIVSVLLGLGLGGAPAHAACKRFGFTVNDYGKEGPIRDAKSLLDKHIAEWTAKNGVKDYQTGKKDVSCELFLNFILFDEHTCTASANVCWGEDKAKAVGGEGANAGAPPAPARKAGSEDHSEADTALGEDVVTPIEKATAGSTPITYDRPSEESQAAKPAENASPSANPVRTIAPAQMAEPAKAEPAKSAGTADKPLGPAKSHNPVKTVEPAKTPDQVKPKSPVRTVEPAKPIAPVKTAKPIEPVKTVEPAKPIAPVKTATPAEPPKAAEETAADKAAAEVPNAVEVAKPLEPPAPTKALEAIESAYKPPAAQAPDVVETGTLGLHASPASSETVKPAPPMTTAATPPPAAPSNKDRAAAAAAAAAAATAAEKAAAAAETAAAAAKEAAAAAVAASAASRGAVVPPLETGATAARAGTTSAR